jgi:broad-specificity NMP kinase
LIKGAPGVGKSAAARLLAKQFPTSALVEVDKLRGMVMDVNWKDQAVHRSILDLSARLAADFLRKGFSPVILVDTFSGDKVHGFLASFRSACPQGRVFVAVLHASEDILRQRVLNREAGGFRDMTTCGRINQEVVCDASPFETLIDTSARSPAEVAREVSRALASSSSLASRGA